MLRLRGFEVRGSDYSDSPSVRALAKEGVDVTVGHARGLIRPNESLVISDAIDLHENPEALEARSLGRPIFRRSQALGWLLREHRIVAVTGTHGKTTTTGLIGAALLSAGFDPLIVVGALVPEYGASVVEGEGRWAVIEACEAYDSLQDFDPTVVVLTNLELDHVDFHGSFDRLQESVSRFVARIPVDGALVFCDEDPGACKVARTFRGHKIGYRHQPLKLALAGRHQELNASGALAAAEFIGADRGAAMTGLARFAGAERRLQVVQDGDIAIVDDYAHHPTEIVASIDALRRMFPDRRIVTVFQPHLYSRTAPLISEFAAALSRADYVVLTDIYPAREAPVAGVSSAQIADLTTVPTRYVPSRHLLPREVARLARPGDAICAMGAGNISEFPPDLVRELNRGPRRRVVVLYGGDSSEREVSLHSGADVHAALIRKGYQSRLFDATEALLSTGDVSSLTGSDRPDVAFLAVHGTHAEDGAIQGLLELLHVPYTGSGINSSALAMDKFVAKQALQAAGLECPRGWLVDQRSDGSVQQFIAQPPSPPLVVKPNAQGSTVGLSFVESLEQLEPAIRKALEYGHEALIEERVEGMEVSVPVLGDRALTPVEIAPKSGIYDFAAKYVPGATDEIVPAGLPAEVLGRLQDQALAAHRALRCVGATRTDMIVRSAVDGKREIVVLEVNTLPGLTGTSLLPKSARASGITFDDLVDWMVQDALREHASTT